MPRDVVLYLTPRYRTVSVIARTQRRLDRLAAEVRERGGTLLSLRIDYRDEDNLRGAVEEAVRKAGPIALAVCWIHSTAPEGPGIVAEIIGAAPPLSTMVHVVGSAVADPSREAQEDRREFERLPFLCYKQAVLGFVPEGNRSRWLTDEEISRGVIDAIESAEPVIIVGTVEPWSMRP